MTRFLCILFLDSVPALHSINAATVAEDFQSNQIKKPNSLGRPELKTDFFYLAVFTNSGTTDCGTFSAEIFTTLGYFPLGYLPLWDIFRWDIYHFGTFLLGY